MRACHVLAVYRMKVFENRTNLFTTLCSTCTMCSCTSSSPAASVCTYLQWVTASTISASASPVRLGHSESMSQVMNVWIDSRAADLYGPARNVALKMAKKGASTSMASTGPLELIRRCCCNSFSLDIIEDSSVEPFTQKLERLSKFSNRRVFSKAM